MSTWNTYTRETSEEIRENFVKCMNRCSILAVRLYSVTSHITQKKKCKWDKVSDAEWLKSNRSISKTILPFLRTSLVLNDEAFKVPVSSRRCWHQRQGEHLEWNGRTCQLGIFKCMYEQEPTTSPHSAKVKEWRPEKWTPFTSNVVDTGAHEW